MLVLVINCGSSSIKYRLYDMQGTVTLAGGSIERIGESSAELKHTSADRSVERAVEAPDHHSAMDVIADVLTASTEGVLSDISELGGIGHRVVHGGERYSESVLIDDEVTSAIEELAALAPLHNPPALEGIKACSGIFRGIRQVAVFDTAFHHRMPEHAYHYALPRELYERYRVRRYGFHGTSHRFVSRRAAEILGSAPEETNVITVHLGNGCSVAAVRGRRSVDTSMGFTPLEGLVMGTRSGDLDPAIVTFLMEKEGLAPNEVEELLNKKSGLLGVSGTSNDMRDILKSVDAGDDYAKLAYDIFVYRIKKYIGSYAAVLGKVDAVVFTAGVGENVPRIRESIESDLEGLFKDPPRFMTVSTDEELLIAADTYELVKDGP